MSRAFVNEDSAADHANAPIERQVSSQPNYVTARGLVLLQAKVSELQAQHAHETAKGRMPTSNVWLISTVTCVTSISAC